MKNVAGAAISEKSKREGTDTSSKNKRGMWDDLPKNRRQDKECATGAAFWHIRMPRVCGADRRETRPIFSFGGEDSSVSVRVPKPKWKHGRVQKKRRAPPAAPTNITFPHETSGGKDASGISQNDQKNQNKEELIAEKQDKFIHRIM